MKMLFSAILTADLDSLTSVTPGKQFLCIYECRVFTKIQAKLDWSLSKKRVLAW